MSARSRVLITDRPWADTTIEQDILRAVGADIIEPTSTSPEELAVLAKEADALGVCWAPITETLVEQCSRCKIITRFGVGLDNIPVGAATRLGIPVTYLPDYCVDEVADHTLTLLLNLVRGVSQFDRSMKRGEYDPQAFLPKRLNQLTVGLVGFGRIGKAVADRLMAFGVELLIATRTGTVSSSGVQAVTLNDLLARSNVVSLHVPLSQETHKLIDARRLSQMKAGSFLINTSRGALVDAAALYDALETGHVAGAALDVFDPEPPREDDPLVTHPQVITTPHVAFRSAEALVELRTRAARQIATALTGGVPEHVVNPESFRVRSRGTEG